MKHIYILFSAQLFKFKIKLKIMHCFISCHVIYTVEENTDKYYNKRESINIHLAFRFLRYENKEKMTNNFFFLICYKKVLWESVNIKL